MGRALTQVGMSAWVGSLLCVTSPCAWAQPNKADLAQADVLFNEALGLINKGQYGAACPKLEESHRLDPAIGTLFNLADCYEHTSRTASAWAGFRDVAVVAAASGQSARAQLARERAAVLEPTLSKLCITVPPTAAVTGLLVQRDSVVVDRLAWGSEMPLDPGKYLVSASAPGRAPWSTVVLLKEPGKVVSVTMPILEPTSPGIGTAAVHGEAAGVARSSTPSAPLSTPARSEPGGPRTAVIITGVAVGVAAAGFGVVSAVMASSSKSERNEKLPVEDCTRSQGYSACKSAYEEANHGYVLFANMAMWSFVCAGVSGTGTALYTILGSQSKPAPGLRAALSVSPQGGVMTVMSSW